jgi:hypothetical protein
MNRLEEASHPLPSSLEDDVALARTRLESISPEAQLEIVQRVFTPAIMERAAWAIPGCPFVRVSSPSIPAEIQEFMKGMIDEILTFGTLPPAMSIGAINALGMSVPRYKTHTVRNLTLLTGAVTIAAAACGPLWAAAAILATGAFLIRGLRHQPDLHGEFAAGCLLECMDADQVIRGTRDTIPTLTKTVDSYFNDPSVPQTYRNAVQSEGFLAARTLRIFGYFPLDIFSGFAAPSSLSPTSSLIMDLLQTSLIPQEVSLTQPLTTVLRNPTADRNSDTISLLETLNAAHFAWALRDKQKLRHEVANLILQRVDDKAPSALG